MADVIIGGAGELDATKNDLITSIVQRELQAAAKLLPTTTDFSRFATKGVQSISIPRFDSFTAALRTPGVACDAVALTAAVDKLDLDKCACVSWLVDGCEEIQSTVEFQLMAAERAAAAHGRLVDTTLITAIEAAATATTTAAPAITLDIVLEMREALCSANANMNELFLVVGCDNETALLKVPEFTNQDVFGPNSAIASGSIGRVLGVQVVVSNLMAAGQYFMYDKSGIAHAFQLAPTLARQPEIQFGSRAERVVVDQLFGVKSLQNNVLLIKDNN